MPSDIGRRPTITYEERMNQRGEFVVALVALIVVALVAYTEGDARFVVLFLLSIASAVAAVTWVLHWAGVNVNGAENDVGGPLSVLLGLVPGGVTLLAIFIPQPIRYFLFSALTFGAAGLAIRTLWMTYELESTHEVLPPGAATPSPAPPSAEAASLPLYKSVEKQRVGA